MEIEKQENEGKSNALFPLQRRIQASQVFAAEWTITKHTRRQRAALRESLERFGPTSPIVVRQVDTGLGDDVQYYEVIDGNERLAYLREVHSEEADFSIVVLDYGAVSDDEARALHVSLNLPRGVIQPGPLADALEVAAPDGDGPQGEALLALLPLVDRTVDAAIAKFRRRVEKRVEHDPDAPQGWVDFRFRVDPDAAEVCDRALTVVEKTTDCGRGVAFERVCADFLAGPNAGREA
jgi:hypothetical protein